MSQTRLKIGRQRPSLLRVGCQWRQISDFFASFVLLGKRDVHSSKYASQCTVFFNEGIHFLGNKQRWRTSTSLSRLKNLEICFLNGTTADNSATASEQLQSFADPPCGFCACAPTWNRNSPWGSTAWKYCWSLLHNKHRTLSPRWTKNSSNKTLIRLCWR